MTINLYHPDRLIEVRREVWVNGMRFGIRMDFCRCPEGKFILYYSDSEWGEDIDGSPLAEDGEITELESWAESYYKEIDYFIFRNMGEIVEEALNLETECIS